MGGKRSSRRLSDSSIAWKAIRNSKDGDFYVDEYNFELEKLSRVGKNTWFVGPWLFAESYPYRLIRSYFKRTTYWTDFDPFRAKKEEAFRNNATAVYREH
ncbi:hypothetical protein F5141DRAFT_1217536 [Pisolithus sp. B1]|nr:hypothetical protein F5141DRAFT_1217536 [Pisolithus sp. B1]